MRVAFLLLLFVASPLRAADWCEEAWFIRNLVMDRAGYCFGSPLGAAMFDNAGCTGTQPQLTAYDRAVVAMIREAEQNTGCAVDTTSRALDLDSAPYLRALERLPARSEYESACVGWRGPSLTLRSAPDPAAPSWEVDATGLMILWQYDYPPVGDGWQVLSVMDDGALVALGWSVTPIHDDLCDSMAG